MKHRQALIHEVRGVLFRAGFKVSHQDIPPGLSFDVAAKRGDTILFIKVLSNIDAFQKESGYSLRKLADSIDASPLLVGERSGLGKLEYGVMYSRFGVPIMSLTTFKDFFLEDIPPLVFAAPGGFYVNLDKEVLWRARNEREISLGDLASIGGVSRKAIQMYCEGMSATVDVALRLEEYLGEELIVPINPIGYAKELPKIMEEYRKLGELDEDIFNHLRCLGYSVVPTVKCPFDALAQHDEITMLAGVSRYDRVLVKRARVVKNVSNVIEKESVMFVEHFRNRTDIEGLPLISREELKRMKRPGKVIDLIYERKG